MKNATLALLMLLMLFATVAAQTDSVDVAIFQKVEVEASYPGGDAAWRQYMQKSLKADVPIKNNAPSGKYTVWAQFIVMKDGSISEIKTLTSLGYGMEEEVVRIINKSGKWNPAMQNGRYVKAYRKQPVTFVVEDESFSIITKTPYVLYTNTDNVLTVDAGKVKNEDLQLTISQGSITHSGNGRFIAKVDKLGRIIINVFGKKNKKIGSMSFEVLSPGESSWKPPTVSKS